MIVTITRVINTEELNWPWTKEATCISVSAPISYSNVLGLSINDGILSIGYEQDNKTSVNRNYYRGEWAKVEITS